MKYDCIIMNPPYDGNLHLKILEQAIQYLKDDNSTCINLSPVRWLQDYLYDYKSCDFNKFENSISKYIKALDPTISAKEMFRIDYSNLGIYTITKAGGWDYYSFIDPAKKGIVDKIMKFPKVQDKLVDTPSEPCLKFPQGRGNIGKSSWYELFSPNKDAARSSVRTGTHMMWINFNSETAAENCRKSYELIVMKFYIGTTRTNVYNNYRLVPYLGEIENPRTHRIGYDSDWINEDLCRIFGIEGFISDTEAEKGSEWEIILETMRAYL